MYIYIVYMHMCIYIYTYDMYTFVRVFLHPNLFSPNKKIQEQEQQQEQEEEQEPEWETRSLQKGARFQFPAEEAGA